MIVYKRFYAVGVIVALMFAGCSQSAKKTAQATDSLPNVSDKKGTACCVSKVPSRFAIIKSDSLSLKKKK